MSTTRRGWVGTFEGPIFFAVTALLLLGGSYAMWPGEIAGTPFPDMTIDVPLRAAASLLLAVIGLEFVGAFVIVMMTDS
jgi:hypothetical protein